MRSPGLLTAIFAFSTLSTAWPWRPSTDNFDKIRGNEGMVQRRQDSSGNTATATATTDGNGNSGSPSGATTANPGSSASLTGSIASSTDGSSAASTTNGSNSSRGSLSATNSTRTTGTITTGTASRTSNGTSKSLEYDPRLPAGGISMITPNPYSGAQYYKIGDYVTFAWNYTSLSVTPTAIDVLASCTANQATYTIATNQTVQPTGQVIWDTKAFQSSATIPLLTESYTLFVYDADSSISAAPRAGYLAPYNQFTFGMYSPLPYTPLGDYQCATCNGALSALERQTLGFLLGMSAITVMSFTLFAGGFGVW